MAPVRVSTSSSSPLRFCTRTRSERGLAEISRMPVMRVGPATSSLKGHRAVLVPKVKQPPRP
ncbi:hypothetical protein JY651_48160 [Pyxidicoccus parkwayensis]|uniref:Uncharacterized protein n=1 Tax=Pyxidicoccus parkwayensis TaxID=2813578 RepID=A0ABX7NVF1_9BACT|nr:hypothetical protein [Pyxidicoccus parkwaysis]QSQ22790.1 hypothetical protein JY651_48160 [Pyxidicoccus parkwaysis]